MQQQLASLPPQQAQQLLLMLLAGGGASLGPAAQQALLSSLGLPHGAMTGPGPLSQVRAASQSHADTAISISQTHASLADSRRM